MKTLTKILFLALTVGSCNQNRETLKPMNFDNFKEWWTYQNNEIDLNGDFEGRTSSNEKITKLLFLDSLTTGNYLPIKVQNKENKKVYFLQKISENGSDFSPVIKQLAETQLYNLNWENKNFPKFNFTDLNGNNYSSENTKNKTIFLKTYFIACQACNKEMPELNAFIEKNKNNQKMTFLSLSLDNPEKLKSFLSKKDYQYNFIPNQREFIEKELNTNQFPTHFVVENGIVKKVFGSARELLNYYN